MSGILQLALLLLLGAALVGGDGLEDAIQASLKLHNEYRGLHGCPPLTLDPELNKIAQAYAEKLAKTGTFVHSHAPGLGENLAYYKSDPKELDMTKVSLKGTKGWYDEITDYNYDEPSKFPPNKMVGHFTQLVWKKSTHVGIGIASGDWNQNGSYSVVVANYKPQGNIMGDGDKWYKENVPRLIGKAGKGSFILSSPPTLILSIVMSAISLKMMMMMEAFSPL